jgi:hypothetical protein
MRIHIVGTFEECEHAADRIARVLDARHVGRITRRDDGLYQVRIDARPRKSSRPERPLEPVSDLWWVLAACLLTS